MFVDVETSGLIDRGKLLDDPAQPWPVSIAVLLTDAEGTMSDCIFTRVRSDGRHIRSDAERVHGISTRQAGRNGVSEIAALAMVVGFAGQAEYLVGFNVEFDRDILVSAMSRRGKDYRLITRPGLQVVDLMKPAAAICRIPSDRPDGQYRYPTLDIACETILSKPARIGAHSAWDDCHRCRDLWLKLRSQGALEAA
jgi:hypothetical protein